MSMIQLCSSLLLAQSGGSRFVTPYILIVPVIVFGLLAVGTVVLVLAFRQMKRSRELLHTERLKAFEAGAQWQEPGTETNEKKQMHNAFWIAFWMVVVGCYAPFAAVSSLVDELQSLHTSVAVVSWISAAAASIAAATCATVLVVRSRPAPASLEQVSGKPFHNPAAQHA